MSAEFIVHDIFAIQGKILFTGEVFSGELTVGMSGLFGDVNVTVTKMEASNESVKFINKESKVVGVTVSGISVEQAQLITERKINFK